MISIATSCFGLALLKGLYEQGDPNAIDRVIYDVHSPPYIKYRNMPK